MSIVRKLPFCRLQHAKHPNQPSRLNSLAGQLKGASIQRKVTHPTAPPVYRPQLVPKVLQKKASANSPAQISQSKNKPVAPPVYRPQPSPRILQPATNDHRSSAPVKGLGNKGPVAPPVYRPQQLPRVLQGKMNDADPQKRNQVKRGPIAPPIYRPQPTPKVLQQKSVKSQPPLAAKNGLPVLPGRPEQQSKPLQLTRATDYNGNAQNRYLRQQATPARNPASKPMARNSNNPGIVQQTIDQSRPLTARMGGMTSVVQLMRYSVIQLMKYEDAVVGQKYNVKGHVGLQELESKGSGWLRFKGISTAVRASDVDEDMDTGSDSDDAPLSKGYVFDPTADYSDTDIENEENIKNFTKKGRGQKNRPKVDNAVYLKSELNSLEDDAKEIWKVLAEHVERPNAFVICCTAVLRVDGVVKKFASHNGERVMEMNTRHKAEALGYHVIQAPQTHSEGQYLEFINLRGYEHQHMGTSKEHCKECNLLMVRVLGVGYSTQTAVSTEVFERYHFPQPLKDMTGETVRPSEWS